MWQLTDWDTFWDAPRRDKKVEAILVTTYGFDPDFFFQQILPRTLINNEFDYGEPEWFQAMRDAMNCTKVVVFTDIKQYAKTHKNNSNIFQSWQGQIFKVDPTQHAKLWLIKTESKIRVAIGSCNIIRDAFQNQLQYIWMDELECYDKPTGDANADYLSKFIQNLRSNLSESSQTQAAEYQNELDKWQGWLKSIKFPKNIKLLATFPGSEDNNGLKRLSAIITDWFRLRKDVKDYHLYIQAFSVGKKLNKELIDKFKNAWHVENIHLLWPMEEDIKKNPRWKGMQLNKTACTCLHDTKCKIHRLQFKQMDDKADRLPHGKLYALWDDKNENYLMVVVGSSNFSTTAWNDSFELCVALKRTLEHNYDIYKLFDINEEDDIDWGNIFISLENEEKEENYLLLEARLQDHVDSDGCKKVLVTLETSHRIKKVIYSLLDFSNQLLQTGYELTDNWNEATLNFHEQAFRVKAEIFLDQDKIQETVPILKGYKATMQEIFPDYEEEWEHRWILRKYGWQEEFRQGEYSVHWMEKARQAFRTVDQWAKCLKESHDRLNDIGVCQDAKKLIAAFQWKLDECKNRECNIKGSFEYLGWEMARAELQKRMDQLPIDWEKTGIL